MHAVPPLHNGPAILSVIYVLSDSDGEARQIEGAPEPMTSTLHHTQRHLQSKFASLRTPHDNSSATTPDQANNLQRQGSSCTSRRQSVLDSSVITTIRCHKSAASQVYENGCDLGWRAGGCGGSDYVGPARLEGSGNLQRASGIDSAF